MKDAGAVVKAVNENSIRIEGGSARLQNAAGSDEVGQTSKDVAQGPKLADLRSSVVAQHKGVSTNESAQRTHGNRLAL